MAGMAAVIGAGSPLWGPPLLRSLPAFQVERMEVVGTRYVAPDEVVERADVPAEASVWDDPGAWIRRVEAHPLVERVRVRRTGWHGLEFTVEEIEPVAFVATPSLRPVDGTGRLLPLDPARHDMDLPIVAAGAEVEGERVQGESALLLLEVLTRLEAYDPGFVANVSHLRPLDGGGVLVRMSDRTHADRILLPAADPVSALRRIELVLGEQGRRVATADARFRGQVVVAPGGDGP